MKLTKWQISVISLLALLFFAACKKPQKTKAPRGTGGLTAQQLLEKGEILLSRKKWERGREALKLIEEFLPNSDEFPSAKLLLADSYFYANRNSYPEAEVEYSSFLNYFPRHPRREYALYRVGLCHYASIENGERDQAATFKAIEAFGRLLEEMPGTPYANEAREKISQCWKRIAERELAVGIFYVNAYQFAAAETRLKGLLETYPEHSDLERAYYYLGEALRRKYPSSALFEQEFQAFLTANNLREDTVAPEDRRRWRAVLDAFVMAEVDKYLAEARTYYLRLIESYPDSRWAGRARDRLLELGQTKLDEELDG
jgi:outer membrane protein assembly factor BamD